MITFMLPLLYFVALLYIIYRWAFFTTHVLSKKQYVLLFVIKILAGFVFYWIYTKHYTYRNTSDAFRYFDDALVVYNDFFKNPKTFFKILFNYRAETPDCQYYYNLMSNWTKAYDYGLYNDNRTIIRANMFMMLFSGGNYFVHIILINFLSYVGLILLVFLFLQYVPINPFALSIVLFLCPSLLFWGSGVLKEGVLLFGLGLMLYYFHKLIKQFNLKSLFLFIIGLLLLIYTKFYVLLSLVPAMVAWLVCEHTNFKKQSLLFTLFYISGFLFIIFLSPILLNYNFVETLTAKQIDFINVANTWGAKSKINIPPINNNPFNLLKNLPTALINTLFRPFFFDAQNEMMLFSSSENLLYLLLLLLSIIYFQKKETNPLLLTAVYFTITLGALIGWVTPIVGAIVRYKIPLLPFFIIIPIYYTQFNKWPTFIKKPINNLYNQLEKWTK